MNVPSAELPSVFWFSSVLNSISKYSRQAESVQDTKMLECITDYTLTLYNHLIIMPGAFLITAVYKTTVNIQ